jgi:hypothetical protein
VGWCDRLLETRISPAVLNLAGGALSYTAASGEVNRVSVAVVQVSGTSYIRFEDQGPGVVIKPQGTGLIADSTSAVRALAGNVRSISISTKDGNDTIRLALGVGMPAAISVNVDPPAAADGTVTIPPYSPDQLTIVGPNGADTLALTPQLAPDGTKDIVLADALIRSHVALEHMSRLTIDLSASSGQHAVMVDRSITRPEAPIALKVIGRPAGGDSLTVTAPGTIPQTFTLSGGSIKVSDVRTGKELMLGPSDNIAIDQPQVAVALHTIDSSGNPVDLGPSTFNTFVLDTGSTSILAASDATGDLENSGLYQVYPIQYREQGVGGYTAMDVSYPYQLDFAGSDGIPHELSNTKILSSQDLQLSFLGPDGIVGMPAMLNRFTSIDMSGWENPQSLDNLSIRTDFPTGTGIPTDSGHWYRVPVKLVKFPNDGQLPGGPIPTSAPLAMMAVTIREDGREVTSNFLLDTGAQLSMVSPSVAKALNLDLSHPSGSIDVGGVGGTVSVPLVPVDQLDVRATNGTSLAWTDLQLGVLDLSVPSGPTIGGVFGMDFLTNGWAAKILPMLLGQPGSSRNGYFDHVYLDYRNSSSGTGTVIFDVDPSRDAPAPPDPHTFSVSYSSIAAVHAVGGNGSDTFNLTPSRTIAYTIDGGSRPTGGANVLRLVPGQPGAAANGSTVKIPGDKAIAYQHIQDVFLGSTNMIREGNWKTWYLSGHVRLRFTKLAGANAVLSGSFFDESSASSNGPAPRILGRNSLEGSAMSPGGLSAPILVLTPQVLDSALRTAVLTDPVNRFEHMLSEIAARRGANLAARSTLPSIAAAPPSIAAVPGQKPGAEQHRVASMGTWASRVSDPVRGEALSQIMALDPIRLKPNAKNLFSR